MDKLIFGTAGIPASTEPRNTAEGIKQIKKLGLGSMEIEFVRSINITEEKAPEIKKAAQGSGVTLTCHGPYYINLNSTDKKIAEASVERILKSARIMSLCGGWSVCFHAAYYMGNKEQAYKSVKESLKFIVKTLHDEGINIWIRPETGGKISQFGSLEELIKISQEVDNVLPCIDFAHHFSRSLGQLNSYNQFADILEQIEKNLGRKALDNMHIHTEGIVYGNIGERSHVNLAECNFNYKDLVKVWKDFKIKGVVTCESPDTQGDALVLKSLYDKI